MIFKSCVPYPKSTSLSIIGIEFQTNYLLVSASQPYTKIEPESLGNAQ